MSQFNERQVDMPYSYIYLQEDGIYKEDDENQSYKIADYMAIKKVFMNIDTNDVIAEVEYNAFKKRHRITVPRTDYMNPLKLITYAGKGLDLVRGNIEDVVRHFRNQEEVAEIEYQHTNIGFGCYDGKEVYKLYNAVGVESTYCGQYDLEPKGHKDKYFQMLENEVLGHAPLELVLIMALSAVIIGYVGEELSLDTLIIHLKGNSSTGKTTAVRLGISAFGYADTKRNGLVSTYNATSNALIGQLKGIKGVPFVFDELSMAQENDLTSVIYTIANGTDKARLNANAELQTKGNWHTAVFSTGEKSLIGSAKKNVGIQNRVIEIDDVVFTKDASNAMRISSTIQQNYGFLAYNFARYVLSIGKHECMSKYNTNYEEVLKIFNENHIVDSFTERRAKSFAAIVTTGKLAEQVLGKQFNWTEIWQMLLSIEKKALYRRSFDKVAIEQIKQYININIGKFARDSKCTGSTYWGKIIDKGDHMEVQMLLNKFEMMLKEQGFEDAQVVLKELKQGGYLNCEKDRYTRYRKTEAGFKAEVYVIKILK